jgi:hypothetical protein
MSVRGYGKLLTDDPIEIYALGIGIYSSTEEMLEDCLKFIDCYVGFREADNGEEIKEDIEDDVVDAWISYLVGRIYAKMGVSC